MKRLVTPKARRRGDEGTGDSSTPKRCSRCLSRHQRASRPSVSQPEVEATLPVVAAVHQVAVPSQLVVAVVAEQESQTLHYHAATVRRAAMVEAAVVVAVVVERVVP